MKIELRNIRHCPSLSEETEAFTASLYIDGVLAGHASNRGNGGPTDYSHANEKGRGLIKQAEAYCKKLPPVEYQASGDMKVFSVPMNLENFIDELLNKHLDEKIVKQFRNRIKKATETAIVVGVPDKSFRPFSFRTPIAAILQHPKGHETIVSSIKNVIRPTLRPEEKILNTNIPEHILKEAGLSEKQYVPQQDTQPRQEAAQKRKGRHI